MNLRQLTDERLLSNTKRLASNEREIMIQVLHHLLEVNRRKVFSPRFKSLFEYATTELGYSADQASRRLDAMRLLKELPEIEGKVASAELNLTVMGLAQNYFRNETSTREEKIEVLRAIEGKSTREVTRELLKRSSQPERMKVETVRPVSALVNEVRIFLGDEVLGKIAKLKGRLAHKHPRLSNAELFEILLDRAIAETNPAEEPNQKRKAVATRLSEDNASLCKTAAPRKPALFAGQLKPAMIAAQLKRAPGAALKRSIFKKGNGECEKCGSTHSLEMDHISPFALGGLTIAENMRLLCRNCNQRERIKVFG